MLSEKMLGGRDVMLLYCRRLCSTIMRKRQFESGIRAKRYLRLRRLENVAMSREVMLLEPIYQLNGAAHREQ